jgi:integrase
VKWVRRARKDGWTCEAAQIPQPNDRRKMDWNDAWLADRLGGALLREAGWSVEQVQDLMTHTSEAMTEHYLGGHEAPWTDVLIGISLKR